MHRCLVVDDDEVTRELAVLFAAEAGLSASAAGSGDEALALLDREPIPDSVLVDLRMPGLAGPALARALRLRCTAATQLVAMSGSAAPAEAWAGFDAFLPKPFTPATLREALALPPVLSQTTYTGLAGAMPRAQLLELYDLSLRDSARRIAEMEQMQKAGDRAGYIGMAHAIKGGCGMVGALELAALADRMEAEGPPPDGSTISLQDFLHAMERLRAALWGTQE